LLELVSGYTPLGAANSRRRARVSQEVRAKIGRELKTASGEKFRKLTKLRDEVVHTKGARRPEDPDNPGVFGRLLLGEGSRCVEDAAEVIIACEPTRLPDGTRKVLGV
jgi:hypothetical protein